MTAPLMRTSPARWRAICCNAASGTVVATPHSNLEGTRTGFQPALLAALLVCSAPCCVRRASRCAFCRAASFWPTRRTWPGCCATVCPSCSTARIICLSSLPSPRPARRSPPCSTTSAAQAIARSSPTPSAITPCRSSCAGRKHGSTAAIFLQSNKGSLLDRLGRSAFETSNRLRARGMVDVIASDAHDMRMRPPGFQTLLPILPAALHAGIRPPAAGRNPNRILKTARCAKRRDRKEAPG